MYLSIKDFYKPTPANIRKFADSVLSACVFAGATFAMVGHEAISLFLFFAGFFSKFFSNLFSDEKSTTNTATTSVPTDVAKTS